MLNNLTKISAVAAAWLSFTWSPPTAAVIGAVADRNPSQTAADFPEVVRLQSKTEVCSGTIIGPRAILSAAHCADLDHSFVEYRGKRYNLNFARSRDYLEVDHDVAVAMTDRDIEGARFAEIGSGLRHGSTILLAGYGCTRRGGPSGPLHLGRTKVIGMDADHILSFQPRGGILCQGDSGGPAFIKERGRHVVVAVNSSGDLKDVNVNVRLDSTASRGFLREVASKFKVAICGVSTSCAPRT